MRTIIKKSGNQGKNESRISGSPRSQSPDWERTCPQNSVSTSLAILLASVLSAHAQLALPSGPASPQPAASPAPELAPIAPPVYIFPYPPWMVATVAVVALLIVAAIVWAVVRHIKNRPQSPPPTPRELALAALERLRNRIERIESYPFSIEVSDVLRGYVQGEFRVRATQQTSPEFFAAASASPRFSEADKALLAAFLEKADLIKFARVAAGSADSEQLLEEARRFVEGGAA